MSVKSRLVNICQHLAKKSSYNILHNVFNPLSSKGYCRKYILINVVFDVIVYDKCEQCVHTLVTVSLNMLLIRGV